MAILSVKTLAAQTNQKNQYVVITFEESYRDKLHGGQRFFWLIPVDSIHSYDSQLYGLFLKDFSKSQLIDCSKSNTIDPTIRSLEVGDYDFDSLTYIKREKLSKVILEKKRLIQTIKKVWKYGNAQTINVYATPIKASFHSCKFAGSGELRYGYRGSIFLLNDFYEEDTTFWASTLANYILQHDFSTFKFKQLAYPAQ